MPPPIFRAVAPDEDDDGDGGVAPLAVVTAASAFVVRPTDDGASAPCNSANGGNAAVVVFVHEIEEDDDARIPRGMEGGGANGGANDGGDDDDVDDEEEDVLSLSSDTSATTLASDTSDGGEAPRSGSNRRTIAVARHRPRSASLHLPPAPSWSSGGTTAPVGVVSLLRPASNPRAASNGRQRRSLVSSSPLGAVVACLGTPPPRPAVAIAVPGGGGAAGAPGVVVGVAVVPGRGGAGGSASGGPTGSAAGDAAAPPPPRRRSPPEAAPRLTAGLRLAPPPRPSAAPARRPADGDAGRPRSLVAPGRSEKQRPSHRKIRRWDNDRFVGTSSERLHVAMSDYDGDPNYREHYMPNYPCAYESEFSRLATDGTDYGRVARDRFARGEVASGGGAGGDVVGAPRTMEGAVAEKFRRLGMYRVVSGAPPRDDVGAGLYRTLCPRLRSVLSRSCGVAGGNDDARNAVAAFEGYLVSLALAGYGGGGGGRNAGGGEGADDPDDDVGVGGDSGYPPLQARGVYDLFGKVLSRPPRIAMRSRMAMRRVERPERGSRVLPAALVPSVHFHFAAENDHETRGCGNEDDAAGRRVGRSSAFHRILLHSVCQFHGLESSSSVVRPSRRGGAAGDRGDKFARGDGHGGGGAEKVVTVQGGVLLAPALKLLDHVVQ